MNNFYNNNKNNNKNNSKKFTLILRFLPIKIKSKEC